MPTRSQRGYALVREVYKERKGVWEMVVQNVSIDQCPENFRNAVDAIVDHLNQINNPHSISREDFEFTREYYFRDDCSYFATLSLENFELRSSEYPLATMLIMDVFDKKLGLGLYLSRSKSSSVFNQVIRNFSGLDTSLQELKTSLTTLFNGGLEERRTIINKALEKKKEEERIEQEKVILKETIRSKSQLWTTTNLPSLVDNLDQIPNITLLDQYTITSTAQEAVCNVLRPKSWYHGSTGLSSFPSDSSLRSSSAARMLQALERLSLLG